MAVDPILKRAATMDALGPKVPGAPVSTTMPVPDPNTSANPNLASPSPVSMPALPDGRNDRRDQWSIGGTITNRGDFGRLTGFNESSFDPMSGEQSFKNQMGRIMSRYDPRSPNAIQALQNDPDFKASGYRIEGNDKIVGPDGFPVDILRNANETGAGDAWAWQTSNPADQGGGAMGGGAATGGTGLVPGSNLGNIMAEISALAGGTESPMKRKAVLDLLMDPAAQEQGQAI